MASATRATGGPGGTAEDGTQNFETDCIYMNINSLFISLDSVNKVFVDSFHRVVFNTKFSLRTDRSLGCFGFRRDAELSWASLVFSCHPEDVSHALEQTFNVQLGVGDDVPDDQDRKVTLKNIQA